MKMFLILLLACSQVFAQSTTPANVTESSLPSLSLQKIKERTRISYFGEILGPSVKKWDDNEVSTEGEKLREPVRMFHSFSTKINIVDKLSFYIQPGFVSVIGDRNDIRPSDNPHVFEFDDMRIGFHNTFYKSQNLSYGQRLTHEHPFSTYSRNSRIDSQIEWTHDLTWQPKAGWRVIHWNYYRYYKFESGSGLERYRINFTTLLNYDFNDKWHTQLAYEFDLQHRNPTSGPKERDWNFFKKYENHMSLGMGYKINRNLNVIPFIRTLELSNLRNDNTIVGLWVLGKVL